MGDLTSRGMGSSGTSERKRMVSSVKILLRDEPSPSLDAVDILAQRSAYSPSTTFVENASARSIKGCILELGLRLP